MRSMSHKERVLRHLNEFGSISTWEAIREYGNTRLSATIFSLKEDGVRISKEMVADTNRFDEPIRFAKYSLVTADTEVEV